MKKILFLLLFLTSLIAQEEIVRGRTYTGSVKTFLADSHGHLVNVSGVTDRIHRGDVYTISKTFIDVANDSSACFRIKSNGNNLHFEIFTTVEGKCYLKTYAGTTYSDTGTVYTPFNRLIGDTTATNAIITYDPVVLSYGSIRGDDLLGSSAPSARAGGSNSQYESVLMPGKEFLLRIHNVSGQASDINIVINYVEER